MVKDSVHVLVVEDVFVQAEMLCDFLRDKEMEPVGPAATVDVALALIAASTIDVAIVDIQLASEKSFPVCRALLENGIPFMFLTAHDRSVVPAEFRAVPLLDKPCDVPALMGKLSALLAHPST